MGKGLKIFFIIDAIFIVICGLLMVLENSKEAVGLPALSSMGIFVVYLIMFLLGVVALIIGILIKIFKK